MLLACFAFAVALLVDVMADTPSADSLGLALVADAFTSTLALPPKIRPPSRSQSARSTKRKSSSTPRRSPLATHHCPYCGGDCELSKTHFQNEGGLPMSSEDEPPRPLVDYWPQRQPKGMSGLLRRCLAEVKRRVGGLRQQGEAETIQCTICGHWPVELRAAMRGAVEAIPIRGEVCDDCLKAFWTSLRKGG